MTGPLQSAVRARVRYRPGGGVLAEIHVERRDDLDGAMRFSVHVREGDSSTDHEVTLAPRDLDRLGARHGSPESFVTACFAFLLEREPKESILPAFDVSAIGGYFPDFERVVSAER